MDPIHVAKRPPADAARQLVVFSLGEEEYALPVARVQEIIRYSEPRPVPGEAAWIRGVISLRGKIVSVGDLAARLGLADAARGGGSNIVIVETADGTAGVVVGDVAEVLTVEASRVEPLAATADGCVEALARIGDRLVVLLDPARIFDSAELAA